MFLKLLSLYILLLYSISTTYSAGLKPEQVLDIVRLCAKNTNVTEAEFDKPEIFLLQTPKENQLCFVKCVMELTKIIDFDGFLQKRVLRNYISAFNSKIQEEILVCADKVERIDTCHDLEDLRKCMEPYLYV